MTSHGSTSGATTGGSPSFVAHLNTLRDFAEELRDQVRALGVLRGPVADLAVRKVALGNFAEADRLLARHDSAVAQVQALISGTEKAIVFAEQVTDTVADRYQRSDQDVAASYGRVPGAGSAL